MNIFSDEDSDTANDRLEITDNNNRNSTNLSLVNVIDSTWTLDITDSESGNNNEKQQNVVDSG